MLNRRHAKNPSELPEGYSEILAVDLQKDKKKALLVNGLSLLIAAVLVMPVLFIKPPEIFLGEEINPVSLLIKAASFIVMTFAYLLCHELIHGIFMRYYSGKKPFYGITSLYAYAGSKSYFNRKSYAVIALSPVLFFFILLAAVNLTVPSSWFWIIYLVQVTNLSGAAGDLYISYVTGKLPRDILIKDSGVSMVIYSAEKKDGGEGYEGEDK